MHNEQVFTPDVVTYRMLEELGYEGGSIRKKHIIDNSCGNGVILRIVVDRYINQCIRDGVSKETIKKELETYIHGIEIDTDLYVETVENLHKVAVSYDIRNVEWDIVRGDAMKVDKFNNKMDYVVGNPPYCKIQDIPKGNRGKVKAYRFCNSGMTDMYLVFFEIGLNMLKKEGKLVYITPNSWLNNSMAKDFRKYLRDNRMLVEIFQYGHIKVFDKINNYCCITVLSKSSKPNNLFVCQRVSDDETQIYYSVENLDRCLINGKIYLTDAQTLDVLSEIDRMDKSTKDKEGRIRAKNGFGTLNDNFFIIDEFVEKYYKSNSIVETTKASNGEKHYFFFPYDANGKPLSYTEIDDILLEYMRGKAWKTGVDLENPAWYLYGRTQALGDVKYEKIIVNNLLRNIDDIKIDVLNEWQGIYSGYYIPLYDDAMKSMKDKIISWIKCDDFVNYIKALGKYKNGGYYTFSSKELEAWLNYKMEECQ